MCDDELIPPQADMTEREWLRAGAAAAPDGPAMPTTGRVPKPVNRRTLLGGAMAGAALTVLASGARPATASAAPRPGAPGAFPFPEHPNGKGEFAVLVTGDAGTGDEAQYAVAAAARDVCRAEGIGLAIGLGDNIYENGPESAHDSDFQDKFEKPNSGIDVPWLMVLGNHDCSGLIPGSGGDPSRGDREVAYATTSKRWYMPARYYSVPLPAADPLVEFFAIDTIPWSSYVAQIDPYFRWDGPYMREQRAWLDGALRASRARWKVVIGHHPYLNNGKHGNAGAYDGFTIGNYTSGVHLKDMYEKVVCGRADLILSGHDHCLQVLEPTARTGGTRQVVCGASAKTEDGKAHFANPAAWQNFSDHGFMVLKVARARLTIDVYTVDVATRKATPAHRTRQTGPVSGRTPSLAAATR